MEVYDGPYRIEEGRLRHPVRLWGDVGRHLECQQTFGNSVG